MLLRVGGDFLGPFSLKPLNQGAWTKVMALKQQPLRHKSVDTLDPRAPLGIIHSDHGLEVAQEEAGLGLPWWFSG